MLTDGGLYDGASGERTLRFDIKDGLAVREAARAGLRPMILSGRANPAVRRRAAELGIDIVVLARSDKGPAFAELCAEHGIRPETVAAIGDDLQDLPVLAACGLSFAPADAAEDVLAMATVHLGRPGGHGAVREAVELLLRARGQWDAVVARFRGAS